MAAAHAEKANLRIMYYFPWNDKNSNIAPGSRLTKARKSHKVSEKTANPASLSTSNSPHSGAECDKARFRNDHRHSAGGRIRRENSLEYVEISTITREKQQCGSMTGYGVRS
ncbi:hypothetical protein Dda3937_03437 [Dickeya dadantii 3937]|uniref:Uncharacterized protein n=1 Tax=Dickeya dadantii (strain 3937) TaxID=198628 RepID=E0SL62_DICD3|nr:hypothetical protein Dda3937_03437 [Dickeya dadantii 3937]